jgi:glycosyltransferase involved in cell wall biosynthesis
MTSKTGLKIGIMGWQLLHVLGGANDFIRNLIRALALRPDTQVYFIAPPSEQEWLYPYYEAADPTMIRLPFDCEAPTLARLRAEYGIDVFLLSIFVYPTSLPYLVYWPDCQHRHLPQFFTEESRRERDDRIVSLLGTGKPMIINARSAKDDMVRFYGANPDQIFNLPVSPIVDFDHLTPRPELAVKHAIPRPYFIICNQFWIHKSLETIVEAADIARQRGLECDFVFTGQMWEPRFPDYPQSIVNMVAERDLGRSVRFLGHLEKPEQLELMKGAIAVLQPTLFEGGPGGGSVYDAIGIGVRAIVSDIPCNRELPEDPERIVFFEPKNASDLVDKMVQVMQTPYVQPSIEDCYRITRRSIELTSVRLYEAIEAEVANTVRAAA